MKNPVALPSGTVATRPHTGTAHRRSWASWASMPTRLEPLQVPVGRRPGCASVPTRLGAQTPRRRAPTPRRRLERLGIQTQCGGVTGHLDRMAIWGPGHGGTSPLGQRTGWRRGDGLASRHSVVRRERNCRRLALRPGVMVPLREKPRCGAPPVRPTRPGAAPRRRGALTFDVPLSCSGAHVP